VLAGTEPSSHLSSTGASPGELLLLAPDELARSASPA
jgi:hypothetical protein